MNNTLMIIIIVLLILVLISVIISIILNFTKKDDKPKQDTKSDVVFYNPLSWFPAKYNPFWSYPDRDAQQQQQTVNVTYPPETTDPVVDPAPAPATEPLMINGEPLTLGPSPTLASMQEVDNYSKTNSPIKGNLIEPANPTAHKQSIMSAPTPKKIGAPIDNSNPPELLQ